MLIQEWNCLISHYWPSHIFVSHNSAYYQISMFKMTMTTIERKGFTSKLCGSINNEYNVCFILTCEMWLFALLHQRKLCNEGISYWNIKTNMPRGRMVVRFTITFAISAYYNWRCEFEPPHSGDTTLCDKACQWLAACRWFSPCPPISSTNKTDRHDITEILLKVALNTITNTTSWTNSSVFIDL
jgi:hypothetical protein